MAGVKAAGKSARLVFVGDGPELSAVRYRVDRLGLKEDVVFVGKQANIANYLGIADVFLLPSELESFGLAALEAQACEVPVVATRIGGIPEVVSDGETGFLSEVGDVTKMTADTLRLLGDEELRRNFGERGRRNAVERYSTEKIIPQYLAFYERVVKKAKAAAAA
jgi:N-acetyl-alpha-D-glucosaminyl L-malate synthase BshA